MTLSNSLYEWTFDVPTGDYGITINDTWGDGLCCEDGVSVTVYNSGFESMEVGVFGLQMFQVKIGIKPMAKANQAIMRLKFMVPVQPVQLPFGKRYLSILRIASHFSSCQAQ